MKSVVANTIPQPTVPCPKCGTPVPLTEALAAPLIEATRAQYESKLRDSNKELERQKEELAMKERDADELARKLEKRDAELKRESEEARTEIETQRAKIATEVARLTEDAVSKELRERLAIEKGKIAEAEQRRIELRFAEDLAERDRNEKAQAERIEQLITKLSAAQNSEADLMRREQEFKDREREFTLKIEQEVSGRLEQVRAVASSEAEDRLSLQLSDKDRTIRELAAKLEDASRKAQQGSQQAQGETLEIVLGNL